MLRVQFAREVTAAGLALLPTIVASAQPTAAPMSLQVKPQGTIVPSKSVDPLAAYADRPIISPLQPGETYLGRVVVELLDRKGLPDSWNIAIRVGPVGIDASVLLTRVTNALVARQSWPTK